MDTCYGVKGTWFEEIFFTESEIDGASIKKIVRAQMSRQNANLNKVKEKLASQAKGVGANAIMNFRYGQRGHKWYTHIFDLMWDSESWYGEGEAVFVPQVSSRA